MSDGEQPYSARPTLTRLPGERIPSWACACRVPLYKKHQEPAECLTVHDIAAWRARHPEATCSERTARALAWLEAEWGR